MDDNFRPNGQPNEPEVASAGGQRIDVTVGGSTPPPAPVEPIAVPVANPEPTLPPVPAAPQPEFQPQAAVPPQQPMPPTDPTAAGPLPPPAPGSVVTSSDGSIGGPAPAPVVAPPSHHGKRWLKIVAIIIIIALLAVGGWLAYQKWFKKDPAPAPAKPVVTIPLLKVGILNANYGNLYPDASLTPDNTLINSQVFEGLVRYENKSKIVPELASAWTTPDDKSWIFTVKSGVKFHDGNTLAPDDVKYSIDTLKATNSTYAQAYAANIATVDVIGTNQVKITTTNPDPALLNKLAYLYIIDDKLPQGDDASQAGTGPYQVKPNTTPSDSSVQLVAFPGYHGGRPTTLAVNFGSATDGAALVKAFQSGQYNIVGPVTAAQAKAANGATKLITSQPTVSYIGFNTVKAGPLQNLQVRQAIRYALGTEAIANARGAQMTPTGQLIPPDIAGYNPSVKPSQQDVEKAKQLIQQAGYTDGFTINLSTADSSASNDELVKQLKAVGITANINQQNSVDELVKYFNGGQADMYSVDYTSNTLDGLDIYQAALQAANYNNPKLTDLLSQAVTEMDAKKRQELLQQAATLIDQESAVAPLYSANSVWLVDKPYVIRQDQPNASISVYFSGVKNK